MNPPVGTSEGVGILPGGFFARRLAGLPDIVALCPIHRDEFYVPHDGRCPEWGCDQQLVVYERKAASGSTQDPNAPH